VIKRMQAEIDALRSQLVRLPQPAATCQRPSQTDVVATCAVSGHHLLCLCLYVQSEGGLTGVLMAKEEQVRGPGWAGDAGGDVPLGAPCALRCVLYPKRAALWWLRPVASARGSCVPLAAVARRRYGAPTPKPRCCSGGWPTLSASSSEGPSPGLCGCVPGGGGAGVRVQTRIGWPWLGHAEVGGDLLRPECTLPWLHSQRRSCDDSMDLAVWQLPASGGSETRSMKQGPFAGPDPAHTARGSRHPAAQLVGVPACMACHTCRCAAVL
jgi:hypothetical protein